VKKQRFSEILKKITFQSYFNVTFWHENIKTNNLGPIYTYFLLFLWTILYTGRDDTFVLQCWLMLYKYCQISTVKFKEGKSKQKQRVHFSIYGTKELPSLIYF